MGPALRPGLGFRPEYFFSGGSIDNNHIAVEKQASASDRRSHNFVGAVLVLNLVSILVLLPGKNRVGCVKSEILGAKIDSCRVSGGLIR